MTEKELNSFTINYIEKKIKESPDKNYIRYTYYELNVKNNLSNAELDVFLRINKDYFENQGYKVYFTDAHYNYNDSRRTVQVNELMIAIKDDENGVI